MGEKQAKDAAAVAAGAGDQDDGTAPAPPLDGIHYCSEHPYRPATAAAAAAVAGGGICAFCLQEKLGRLVSSSKSSSFFPLGGHPPPSGSPSSPPSFRRATEPLAPPLHPSGGASHKFMSFHRKKTPSSSSSSSAAASVGGGGLKRSKSVAPRPELEQFPYSSSSSLAAESPRKKSFWSFLSLTSSAYAHQAAASTPYATNAGAAAAARRKSVSVASAAWASRAGAGAQDQQPRGGTGTGTASTLGRTLEAIGEPESPSQSQVSSSSSFGRKVARSRSVGCGSRSFSGDFLERLSNGFGDCTLRRVESHREPKPHKMRGGGGLRHLGDAGANDDDDEEDDVYEHQHRIKCAGFFGGLGPASSSWLSAAEAASVSSGSKRSSGRSHRSWAWALVSPMRALRPTTTSTSTKTITVVPASHVTVHGNSSASALSIPSPAPPPSSSSEAKAAAAPVASDLKMFTV
ncbi:uncharacterized protein [Miscanthus floridulus]|uniref:uncharacterized protein n=1 Tax=Miscanthus floridulus TaxID=154761 RepID=UPI00345A2637